MITIHITGRVANMVKDSDLVKNPDTPDAHAFVAHWNGRTERGYGKGYRVTLTVPAWVVNWIMDTLDDIQYRAGTDLTRTERKAIETLRSDLLRQGIRNYTDGPTRAELVEGGYLPAEPCTMPPVETVEDTRTQMFKCAGCGMTYRGTLDDVLADEWTSYRRCFLAATEWFCGQDCRSETLESAGIHEDAVTAHAERLMRGL